MSRYASNATSPFARDSLSASVVGIVPASSTLIFCFSLQSSSLLTYATELTVSTQALYQVFTLVLYIMDLFYMN